MNFKTKNTHNSQIEKQSQVEPNILNLDQYIVLSLNLYRLTDLSEIPNGYIPISQCFLFHPISLSRGLSIFFFQPIAHKDVELQALEVPSVVILEQPFSVCSI